MSDDGRQKCATCKYWMHSGDWLGSYIPDDGKWKAGYCRRYPPDHPKTREDAWCGEWGESEP